MTLLDPADRRWSGIKRRIDIRGSNGVQLDLNKESSSFFNFPISVDRLTLLQDDHFTIHAPAGDLTYKVTAS